MKQLILKYAAPPLFLCAVFAAAFAFHFVFITTRDWVSPYGVWVKYYNDAEFRDQKAVRPLRSLATYYQYKPAHGVRSSPCYALVDGWLRVPENGKYEFATLSNGGLRFYIDGRLLVDGWKEQSWHQSGRHADNVELSKGYHQLRLEFFRTSMGGRFRVEWCGGVIPPRTTVDVDYLRKTKP